MKGIRTDLNELLTNFSPRSKERNKVYPDLTEEIDVLIATDCISEGQNLQDCDYLVNYDIHWNPVRIIQRFGRIDRLGSVNNQIQLVNFWPNMEILVISLMSKSARDPIFFHSLEKSGLKAIRSDPTPIIMVSSDINSKSSDFPGT